MPNAITAHADTLLLSMNYDPTGLAFVDLFDNPIIGWVIDETGAVEPLPAIIGALPPAAPDTAPIVSPQWAHLQAAVFVPDVWRGTLDEFFAWLATNNGATRLVRGNFVDGKLSNTWRAWAAAHPAQVWDGTL
jgi:hypothetical protein